MAQSKLDPEDLVKYADDALEQAEVYMDVAIDYYKKGVMFFRFSIFFCLVGMVCLIFSM